MKTLVILFLLTAINAHAEPGNPANTMSTGGVIVGASASATTNLPTTQHTSPIENQHQQLVAEVMFNDINYDGNIVCRPEFVQIGHKAWGHTGWTTPYFAIREMESWTQSIGTVYETVSLTCKKASPNDDKE